MVHKIEQIYCRIFYLIFVGTNVEEAKRILKESNLPILSAVDLDDAAQKAVQSLSAWVKGQLSSAVEGVDFEADNALLTFRL